MQTTNTLDTLINSLISKAAEYEAAARDAEHNAMHPRIARCWRFFVGQYQEEAAALMWRRQGITEQEATHLAGLLVASGADKAYRLMREASKRPAVLQAGLEPARF